MSRILRVLVVLAFLPACGAAPQAEPQATAPPLEAGGLVAADPKGFERALRTMRGSPVVVNFWATWCEPCKEEMPRFVDAAKRYGQRVRFLGVDVEDTDDAAERFIERFGIPFPSLADHGGDIRRSARILGLPTTQFYRADGELAFVHSGEISAEDLEARIQELLQIGRPISTPRGAG